MTVIDFGIYKSARSSPFVVPRFVCKHGNYRVNTVTEAVSVTAVTHAEAVMHLRFPRAACAAKG